MAAVRRPLLVTLALALVLALLPGLAQARLKPFSDLVALDDQRLDQLRGGLDAGTGLMVSFGFVREVSINGEIVARQLLVINDLAGLLQGMLPSVQVIANLGQVVQNGTGNFVGSSAVANAHAEARDAATTAAGPVTAAAASNPAASTSAPNAAAGASAASPGAAPAAAAASPAAAAPNAAPAGTPVSASAAPAPSTAPAASAAAPAAAPASASLMQPMTIHTPTGTVTMYLPNTALIVQNTLHNVSIHVSTALSAAMNSVSLARALVLAGQARAP